MFSSISTGMFKSCFKLVKFRRPNKLKHIVIAVGSMILGVKMMVDVVTLYLKYSAVIVTNCQSSPAIHKQMNCHEEKRVINLAEIMIRVAMGKTRNSAVTL